MAIAAEAKNTRPPPPSAGPGRSGRSPAGLAAGISGSLIWGTAFAVPVLLGGWNPVIVTLGRYLVYGLLSALLLALGGRTLRHVLREHLRAALIFAVSGNVGYYLLLVIEIKAAGAPLADMVIGAIPVVVAVAGNLLAAAGGRTPWRRRALLLIVTTAGLALVSGLETGGVHAYLAVSPAEKAAGLIAAVGAV